VCTERKQRSRKKKGKKAGEKAAKKGPCDAQQGNPQARTTPRKTAESEGKGKFDVTSAESRTLRPTFKKSMGKIHRGGSKKKRSIAGKDIS